MKNLTNKTFILLASILSIFLIVLIVFYNQSIYLNEKTRLEEEIRRIEINKDNNFEDDKRPNFIGTDVYIVTFRNNKIIYIENYSQDEKTIEEINEIISTININQKGNNKNKFLGNLYFDEYIFSTSRDGKLMIIKNETIKNNLTRALTTSVIIFTLSECIIVIISKLLTTWLVKPVKESFEKQKNFIYDASHELKTPIAIILASSEALEKSPKDKKLLNNIKSETERMDDLVKKLLELSRTENKNTKELSEENISKIVLNRSLTFESLAFEQNINIESNIKENIMFKCDPEQIKEVINILVDNAIKHSEKKSTIKINLYKEKNNIVLDVINKGEEIPLEDRKKIFDRFYRVDKSRNRNENRYGLGLAIAKNIVENYNGKISVNCKDGFTTFTVVLKAE